MSSADQQTERPDAVPVERTIIYSSPASLLCLIAGIAAGYVTVMEYKQGATDQIKYAAIMATIILLLSCGLAVSRSLRHLELSLLHLRSVKVTLIIQAVIGIVHAFTLYYSGAASPGFRDALLSSPIILAIITCVLALYGYLFYTNITQTHLFFFSVTVTIIEVIISLIVFIIIALWVLSKNIESKPVRHPR
jgi:hypothetical protein